MLSNSIFSRSIGHGQNSAAPYVDDGILCITTKNFVQRRIYLSFLATSTRPGWPSQEEEILFCLPLYFFVTPVLGANRSAAAAVSITRTRLIDRSSLAALLYSVRSFTLISRQEQPIYSRSYREYISPKHLLPSFLLPFYYIELCWLLLDGRLGAASFYFVIYLSSLYAMLLVFTSQ